MLNSCNKIGSKARVSYTSNGHKSARTAGRSKLIDSMNLSFMNNKIFPDNIIKKTTACYVKYFQFLRTKWLLLLR